MKKLLTKYNRTDKLAIETNLQEDIMDDLRDLIREHLVQREGEVLKDLIIQSGQLIALDPQSSSPISLKLWAPPLRKRELVALYCLARRFLNLLDPSHLAEISRQELEKSLKMDGNEVSAYISELKEDGFVTATGRGRYRAELVRMKELVEEIVKRVQGS